MAEESSEPRQHGERSWYEKKRFIIPLTVFLIGGVLTAVDSGGSGGDNGTGVSVQSGPKTDYQRDLGPDCLPQVRNFSRFNDGDREMVLWATQRIYENAESPEWWCSLDVRVLTTNFGVNEQRVPFALWTDRDFSSPDTYEYFYDVCRTFIEPFERHGVSFSLTAKTTQVEVLLDGSQEFTEREKKILEGDFEQDKFTGGCHATVYFESVADELREAGWREGRGDRTFTVLQVSERNDYYSPRKL